VHELIKKFELELTEPHTGPVTIPEMHNDQQKKDKWTFGIISPYRAQASLMGKLIESTVRYIAGDRCAGYAGQ